MREIYQGIRDYIKDVRHDMGYSNKTPRPAYLNWKEGSVWHYIRQRQVVKRVKRIRKLD